MVTLVQLVYGIVSWNRWCWLLESVDKLYWVGILFILDTLWLFDAISRISTVIFFAVIADCFFTNIKYSSSICAHNGTKIITAWIKACISLPCLIYRHQIQPGNHTSIVKNASIILGILYWLGMYIFLSQLLHFLLNHFSPFVLSTNLWVTNSSLTKTLHVIS